MTLSSADIAQAAENLKDFRFEILASGAFSLSPAAIRDIMTLVAAAPQIELCFKKLPNHSRVVDGVTLPPGFQLDTNLIEFGVFKGCGGRVLNILRAYGLITPGSFRNPPVIDHPDFSWRHGDRVTRLEREPNCGEVSIKKIREALQRAGFVISEFPCLQMKNC